MTHHSLYFATILAFLRVTTKSAAEGCYYPTRGIATCSFENDFCFFSNVNQRAFHWTRSYYVDSWSRYAQVILEGHNTAVMRSDWICASPSSWYEISFQYYISRNSECGVSLWISSSSMWSAWSMPPGEERRMVGVSEPIAITTLNNFQIEIQAQSTGTYCFVGIDNIELWRVNSPRPSSTTRRTTTSAARTATVSTEASTVTTKHPISPKTTGFVDNERPANATERTGELAASSNNKGTSAGNGIGIGVGVAIAVIAVVMAVIIFIVIRRKRGDRGTPGILPCLYKKQTTKMPSGEILNGGVDNVAYSPDAAPNSVRLATSNVDSMHGKVNKPKTQARNKTPAANKAVPGTTMNDGSPFEIQNGSEETDDYSTPDDAPSTANNHPARPKGDNRYELAAATALYSTPGNTTKNTAKATADANARSGHEDGYNKLTHGSPSVGGPGGPHTNIAYDHLGEHKQSGPIPQAESYEYSLARPMETLGTSSKSGSRKQNYVNVNPDQTVCEKEYNSLDFDHSQGPETEVRSHVSEDGHDVYSHLQGEDQYRSLDFDGHGQNRLMSEESEYSHIGGNHTLA